MPTLKKVCERCDGVFRHRPAQGVSPKRCYQCANEIVEMVRSGNMGWRPKGHSTRQQHKHVLAVKE